MNKNTFIVLALGLLASLALPLQADTIFINGEVPYSTATGFSDTVNGLTATFSSPADPGGFSTTATVFSFGPEILYDPGTSGQSNIPLDVAFSTPITSVSIDFAIDGSSGPFDLTAFLGGNTVGTSSATGTLSGGLLVGTISFSGPSFDSIQLTSPDTPYFAIGNLDVSDADTGGAVPEPATMTLLGAGMAALTRLRSKRRT